MKLRTTVIRLVVSVPVLSEQMVVALPIVSQAYKCLTRLLSFIILYTDHTHTISNVWNRTILDKADVLKSIKHTYTDNRFTALWILSGTTRWAGTRRNIHPLTWSSIVPYLLHQSNMIYSILPVQSTCLTVFFHNLNSIKIFENITEKNPQHIKPTEFEP